MVKAKFDYDVIVIGSGAAGSVAAEVVARSGKKVAVIEQGDFGGSAPNTSVIPVSALLTAAHNLESAHRASMFGLRTATVGYNFPLVQKWKELAIRRSGASATGEYFRSRGISLFRGRAHFLSPNEISIGRRHLTANKFIIATGSEPLIPKITGLENIDFLTPKTAINLSRPPKSLFIIGAGSTGCQFAELFAIFGTKIHLADVKKRILPREDDEVSELFQNVFTKIRDIKILNSSRVIAVKKEGSLIKVTYLKGEKEYSVKVDKVLIATGLQSNVDLGLENAGVEYDRSSIKTDEFLQTSMKNIFVAGDVLGRSSQVHDAIYEGKLVANNLFARTKTAASYHASPRVIWLNPEIAVVGATETDLVRDDIKFRRSIIQNSVVARANISNFAVGFTKILADKNGKILGAAIVAPNAAETINTLALAIQQGLTATQIANMTHQFGSWSEVVRLACAKI